MRLLLSWMLAARCQMLDAPSVISTEVQQRAEYAVRGRRRMGWGRDHHPGRSDETGERSGRARVKSLTVVRLNNERCLHSGRHDKKTAVWEMSERLGRARVKSLTIL